MGIGVPLLGTLEFPLTLGEKQQLRLVGWSRVTKTNLGGPSWSRNMTLGEKLRTESSRKKYI